MLHTAFMPHGVCYLWSPAMVWLQVASNAAIALCYFFIPVALVYMARRRDDLLWNRLTFAFAMFILWCGLTHIMDIVTIWHPYYWIDVAVRGATALASVGTVFLIVRYGTQLVDYPSHVYNVLTAHVEGRVQELQTRNTELATLTTNLGRELATLRQIVRDRGPNLPPPPTGPRA